jgi:hypothetical protein
LAFDPKGELLLSTEGGLVQRRRLQELVMWEAVRIKTFGHSTKSDPFFSTRSFSYHNQL